MSRTVGSPGLKLTIRVGKKSKTFKSIREAAKHFKIPYGVLYQRLFVMEWSPQKAATTKVRKLSRKSKPRRKK